jgi:hypothetical protein
LENNTSRRLAVTAGKLTASVNPAGMNISEKADMTEVNEVESTDA